jgi:hypothetical protein
MKGLEGISRSVIIVETQIITSGTISVMTRMYSTFSEEIRVSIQPRKSISNSNRKEGILMGLETIQIFGMHLNRGISLGHHGDSHNHFLLNKGRCLYPRENHP